jgi:predicted O-methyltransferase YrrM
MSPEPTERVDAASPAPRRRLSPWLAAVAGAAVAVGLGATGVLDWPTVVIVALLLALGALLLHVGGHVRVLMRTSRRLANRVERLERGLDKQGTRRAADHATLLERLADAKGLQKSHGSALVAARDEARASRKELHDFIRTKFGNLTQHVTRQGRVDFEQVVAWQELRELLRPERAMPTLRGWAAAPDVMLVLVETIRDRKPRLVVECGSGASSVWLALALRRFGGGRLVSLENDERCAALTRDLLAAHGLADLAGVRHAPRVPWAGAEAHGARSPWYELAAVRDLADIDLLFVDGPRGRDAEQARYPAGPVLIPRCSGRAVIVLDDADREDERTASDRWLETFSFLRRDTLATEKGTHVFHRD